MKEYSQVVYLDPSWETVLQKYKINWIFETAGGPLSTLLLERPDWRLIYADRVAHIYVKNVPENQQIIQRFPDVKPAPPDSNALSSK
jgi:hypothetical protein